MWTLLCTVLANNTTDNARVQCISYTRMDLAILVVKLPGTRATRSLRSTFYKCDCQRERLPTKRTNMLFRTAKALCLASLALSFCLEGWLDYLAIQATSEALPPATAYEGVPEIPSIDGRLIAKTQQETDYRSPLEEFSWPIQNAPLPSVLDAIERYKQQHSDDALRNDPMIEQRRFIVATYSCPTSAGNWLHYFTSHFFWGILTNRTILWRYADYDTCMNIREEHYYNFNMKRCNESGVVADCDRFLTRAPWIASFDEWKEKLSLPYPHHIEKEHTQWFLDIPEVPYRTVSLSYAIVEQHDSIVSSSSDHVSLACCHFN